MNEAVITLTASGAGAIALLWVIFRTWVKYRLGGKRNDEINWQEWEIAD